MERIQANVEELKTSIPEFQEIRYVMNSNPKYDYHGDELFILETRLYPMFARRELWIATNCT